MAETVRVDPNHVKIDATGKVEITNKQLADRLKKLLENDQAHPNFSADALLDVNFGC
jgi:hypothetical protein